MDLIKLFHLLKDSRSAFRRLGLEGRSEDLRLSHEVRMTAASLDNGEFKDAMAFVKQLAEEDTPKKAYAVLKLTGMGRGAKRIIALYDNEQEAERHAKSLGSNEEMVPRGLVEEQEILSQFVSEPPTN